MLRQPDLRLIRSFIEVARWRHFGRAAEELNTTQPAISQHLKKLEDQIGFTLLERGGNQGIFLTPAGDVFLHHAKRLLDLSERMVIEARNVAEGRTGTLHLGLSSAILSTEIPALLRRFREDHPGMDLQLSVQSAEVLETMLRDGDVDAAITTLLCPSPSIDATPIYDLPIGIACAVDDPVAGMDTVDPSDLHARRLILFPRQTAPETFDSIISMFHAAGATPEIQASTIPFPSVLALVGSGAGYGIVPLSLSGVQPDDVLIKPLRLPAPPVFRIYLQSLRDQASALLPALRHAVTNQ